MRVLAAVAVLIAANPVAAQRVQPETIAYETSACFGACPVYRVVVSADGRGMFEGRRFTAAKGVRQFRVSPAEYAEFRRRLIADRPVGEIILEGPKACEMFATDMPTVDVKWFGGTRRPSHLRYYLGCDMEKHRRLARALASAPAALPIGGFIGARPAPTS